MMKRTIWLLILLPGFLVSSFGQEEAGSQEDGPQEERHHRHTLAIGGGTTFIRLAGQLGTSQASGIFVPSIDADYTLHLNPHWALGLMWAYEPYHYMIIDSQVERENAMNMALVGKYYFGRHWAVLLGGGMEIEPHQNLALVRVGIEYAIELKSKWELIPTLHFDLKENYDTWTFTLTFARKF